MTDDPSDALFMNPLIADADLREMEKCLLVADADLREMEKCLLVADADLRAIEKHLEASPSVEDLYPPHDDIVVSEADKRLYEQMITAALTPKTPEQKSRQLIEETLRLMAKSQKQLRRWSNNKKRH